MAILASKAHQMRVGLDETVIELIAKRIQRNVRELEGSLTRMVAYSQIMNVSITAESTMRILDDLAPVNSRDSADPARIVDEVAAYYGVSSDDLMARNRTKKIAAAPASRHVSTDLRIETLSDPRRTVAGRPGPLHRDPGGRQDQRRDQRKPRTLPGGHGHQGGHLLGLAPRPNRPICRTSRSVVQYGPMKTHVIVKTHELALKGKNRPWFMRCLEENLRRATRSTGLSGCGGNV